ncbi:aldehyde dehydrogenase family protein [Devosia sp.]|uniref:aldehyde dehydrogenase family protein n=1 Tax=Devosia sp. TaxID=1871048 RepID=UPI002AFF3ABE|nr:aldehyde dehydrogenase family protein [Devosia sp.]
MTALELHPQTKAFLARTLGHFIAGQVAPSQGDKTSPVHDPGRGIELLRVPLGTQADVDRAVAAARAAFDTGPWRGMKPNMRTRVIWKFADLIEEHTQVLAELESINNGMPIGAAKIGHIGTSVDLLRYAAGWPTKLTGRTIPVSAPGEWHAYTLRDPVGVVAQIVPWNGPLMMAAWKLAPALASGCTIVLKPAEQTPLSAIYLAELAIEAGIPEGVFNVVLGGAEVGAALSAHPDVDKIAFTGSTAVGRAIAGAAAQANFTRVTRELGGKSPVIVFPDADLSAAIPAIAAGIFSGAGQICTAGSRLYVHEKAFDRVLEGVAEAAGKLSVGYGLDPATQMGPLISAAHLQRVAGMTENAVREGASVVTGAEAIEGGGYFYKPTILASLTPDSTIVREEVFGPVLSALRFNDDDLDAIAAEANGSAYGLAASIFTRDFSLAHRMAARVRAGTIGINRHFVGDSALPFGGFRQSGWGREKGEDMFNAYLETKAIAAPL